MSSTGCVCTLFDGDYHLGAAALINSLHRSGYTGRVICGSRGPRPAWADLTARVAPLQIEWVSVPEGVHLTYYKPAFLAEIWQTQAPEADYLVYFDPDIVVKAPWSVIETWVTDGIALCEDVNVIFPARHPYRLNWLSFFARHGLAPVRSLERYYNAGFVGLPKSEAAFLTLWKSIIDLAERELGSLSKLKNDRPEALFHSADQDALNMALLLDDVLINASGPEGMDFIPGGHLLSHAAGRTKPWRGGFLREALGGWAPGTAQKSFLDFAASPLPALPADKLKALRTEMTLAILISRFYRRS